MSVGEVLTLLGVALISGEVFGGLADRVHGRIAIRKKSRDDARIAFLNVLSARTMQHGPYR